MNGIKCLLLSVILSGCSVHKLAPEWEPLQEVVESDLPFVSDTATTTIGSKIFVVDLDNWIDRYPINSDEYRALLLHEQIHAQRQLDGDLSVWLFHYVNDPSFRWEEEKLGWRKEIEYLRDRGKAKSAEHYAVVLTSKYQGMVTYDEALLWTRQILAQ